MFTAPLVLDSLLAEPELSQLGVVLRLSRSSVTPWPPRNTVVRSLLDRFQRFLITTVRSDEHDLLQEPMQQLAALREGKFRATPAGGRRSGARPRESLCSKRCELRSRASSSRSCRAVTPCRNAVCPIVDTRSVWKKRRSSCSAVLGLALGLLDLIRGVHRFSEEPFLIV